MRKHDGWVIVSPEGEVVSEFETDKSDAIYDFVTVMGVEFYELERDGYRCEKRWLCTEEEMRRIEGIQAAKGGSHEG